MVATTGQTLIISTYGENISKLFFSETTELLESKVAWNAHPVVAL